MTDIFFSYSSKDRERVRPMHEALEKMGFDIFWDQQVPAGTDWDNWIKDHLKRCRAAIVFWSSNAVASNNVRQEATIASNEGKLVQVMFEPLRPEQFPMGLYSAQAMNLAEWTGDTTDQKWFLLLRELEVKVTPRWIMMRVMAVEANLKSERQKREAAEARVQALEQQLSIEIDEQVSLKEARDAARRELERAKGEAQRAAGGSQVGVSAARGHLTPFHKTLLNALNLVQSSKGGIVDASRLAITSRAFNVITGNSVTTDAIKAIVETTEKTGKSAVQHISRTSKTLGNEERLQILKGVYLSPYRRR